MHEDWENFLDSLELERPGDAAPTQANRSRKQPSGEAGGVKKKKRRRSGAIAIVAVVWLCVVLLGAAGWLLLPGLLTESGLVGDRIPNGVSAAGVDLSGMTEAKAVKALKAAFPVEENDIVVTLPDTVLHFSPADTGAAMDWDAIVAGAMEGDQIADLADYLLLNETYIRGRLSEYARQLGADYRPAEYQLVGTIPDLSEKGFDETVSCPVLVLSVGSAGMDVDIEQMYQQIVAACLSGSYQVDGQALVSEKEPEKMDLDAILDAVCIEPVDARLDEATGEAVPGSYGIGADRAEARKLLGSAGSGDTVEIPLHYIAPTVAGQEVYFQDILGFAQTPHSDNEKRTKNLQLACQQLNGVVMQPGDTLSYNFTLGQRTEENGYEKAPAYSGTVLVDSLGGGICQVSSTLYLASCYAEFEAVERVSHGFPASYMPIALDATVSWGAPDLKIRNTSEYPVKIVAEVCDGYVRVWLMGTEVRDYTVKMRFSSGGTYGKSVICHYDPQTDALLEEGEVRFSSYLEKVTSVQGILEMGQIYVHGNVRSIDPCSPTPETLEASRNYRGPNAYEE